MCVDVCDWLFMFMSVALSSVSASLFRLHKGEGMKNPSPFFPRLLPPPLYLFLYPFFQSHTHHFTSQSEFLVNSGPCFALPLFLLCSLSFSDTSFSALLVFSFRRKPSSHLNLKKTKFKIKNKTLRQPTQRGVIGSYCESQEVRPCLAVHCDVLWLVFTKSHGCVCLFLWFKVPFVWNVIQHVVRWLLSKNFPEDWPLESLQ